MPECARCGAFTDNPAVKQYHYCDNCRERFDRVQRDGIVIRQLESGEYDITLPPSVSETGGREQSQTDALARGKRLGTRHGLDVLFEYERTGSRWLLEEFLRKHSHVKQDVDERLRRAPERRSGLFARIRSLLGR